MTETWLALGAVALLAAVHLAGGHLRFIEAVPRHWFLSLASGISVAYVFLELLPGIAEAHEVVSRELGDAASESQLAFLVALGAFALFYGLERMVRSSRGEEDSEITGVRTFWLHIAVFTLLGVLIGRLAVERSEIGLGSLAIYTSAVGVKLVVVDYGLAKDHGHRYERFGRYLLAAGLVAGWAAGVLLQPPEIVTVLFEAALAGAILLNVLKEELPEARKSRFTAFLAGAVGYGFLLLLL